MLYRDKRWIKYREEILQMDEYSCVKCGRTTPEVTLQVHHKKYEKGKPPWDYPAKDCETLCRGCHAREHGVIRPNVDTVSPVNPFAPEFAQNLPDMAYGSSTPQSTTAPACASLLLGRSSSICPWLANAHTTPLHPGCTCWLPPLP